ncbi:MAG: EndoU domain-containing protein [Lachnospiraceae bacterium]|nr:EndoU domain-containing protein [Lachnospiraceae bacterium]
MLGEDIGRYRGSRAEDAGNERDGESESKGNSQQRYEVSDSRRKHILDGEPYGTGHGPNRGNTEGAFPDTWTDDQTIDTIERVANSPNSTWKQATGSGYTNAPVTRGRPDPNAPLATNSRNFVRFKVQGWDHGQNIEVIIEPNGEGIITGYVK